MENILVAVDKFGCEIEKRTYKKDVVSAMLLYSEYLNKNNINYSEVIVLN